MRACVIEDGVVINIIEVSSLSDLPNLVAATEGDIGWHYDGSTFIDPNAPTDEEADSLKASFNRERRDILIAETDWWASVDLTMTAEQTAYRQALRDITSHANWPNLSEADWPTKP